MQKKFYKGYSKYWNELYFDHVVKASPDVRGFEKERFHSHERYELYYLHSGDITQIIDDRKYKLKNRDLVLIKANSHHCITIDSSALYEHFVIVFDPVGLGIDNMHYWPEDTEIVNCQKIPMITELFQKLDYYYNCVHTDELRDIVTLLIREILYNLGYANAKHNQSYPDKAHPLTSAALEYINANLFAINNVDEIAEKLFVTRGYLYRIFKQELNTTPLRYITEKRLTAAQDMILQGKSPTKVYTLCGFNDYTTFYRNYVKAFGHPPSK